MRDVMDLLSDMLQAVDPSDRSAVRDEVIIDLVERCRSNQKKLMQMLTTTGDEETLARGLELNKSLQTLLAKHDAIASGSPFPFQASKPVVASPKSSEAKDSIAGPSSSSHAPATVSVEKSTIDEEDEEEDEFAQLAQRHSKTESVPRDKNGRESQKSSSTDAVTAVACNALALPDPPAPVNTSKEQKDMIDLLSITLSTTPLCDQNPHTCPQHYPGNQGQSPYNSYVAPWARPHSQGQPRFQPQPQLYPQLQIQPPTRPHYSQYQYGYPPPPWTDSPDSQPSSSATGNVYWTPRANPTPSLDLTGRSLQYSNSFPVRLNNGSGWERGETRGFLLQPGDRNPLFRRIDCSKI